MTLLDEALYVIRGNASKFLNHLRDLKPNLMQTVVDDVVLLSERVIQVQLQIGELGYQLLNKEIFNPEVRFAVDWEIGFSNRSGNLM